MIEFFKHLLYRIKSKSENEAFDKFSKFIYSLIILCAIIFVGFILYFIVKQWPNIVASIQYNWNHFKSILNTL